MKSFRALLVAVLVGILGGVGIEKAYSSIQLGGSIWPLTYITNPPYNLTDAFNQMESLINQQAVSQASLTQSLSIYPNSNPLLYDAIVQYPIASINQPVASYLTSGGTAMIISGTPLTVIYPQSITAMAYGGTTGGSTALDIVCYPSNKLIATWNINAGALLSGVPIMAMVSSANAFSSAGLPMMSGCLAGDSVIASAVGTMTTATGVMFNMPYILSPYL